MRRIAQLTVHQGVYAVGHLPASVIDRAAAAVLAWSRGRCGEPSTTRSSPATCTSLRWRSCYIHRSWASFEDDRERDAEHLLAGFRTVRITWQRLTERPAAEAQRLRRILAQRPPMVSYRPLKKR